jgi:hypothetical protein
MEQGWTGSGELWRPSAAIGFARALPSTCSNFWNVEHRFWNHSCHANSAREATPARQVRCAHARGFRVAAGPGGRHGRLWLVFNCSIGEFDIPKWLRVALRTSILCFWG